MMNCTRTYPGATAWSSGGDIYVRLSPGGAARRVTSTGDWDSSPVVSPNDRYLVFLRATGSGERATDVGAVCFTTMTTHMLTLPETDVRGGKTRTYGKPVFAPSENSTTLDSDWIVLPQYWQRGPRRRLDHQRAPAGVQRPDELDVGLVEPAVQAGA